jgi:hypothetical protein
MSALRVLAMGYLLTCTKKSQVKRPWREQNGTRTDHESRSTVFSLVDFDHFVARAEVDHFCFGSRWGVGVRTQGQSTIHGANLGGIHVHKYVYTAPNNQTYPVREVNS